MSQFYNLKYRVIIFFILCLRQKDPELYGYLLKAELGTIFALPWLITWFGHVLPDYGDVVRLYDYFLAQPPLMPVYLAAAIVLYRREDILTSGQLSLFKGSLSGPCKFFLSFKNLFHEKQFFTTIPVNFCTGTGVSVKPFTPIFNCVYAYIRISNTDPDPQSCLKRI